MKLIVQAGVCLHNYLLKTDNARYVPGGFADCYSGSGDIVEGGWRAEAADERSSALRPLGHQGSHNYMYDARDTRERFCAYFNSNEGAVPWQVAHVNATRSGQTGSIS